MSLLLWLALYLVILLFCLWLIRWGGADLLGREYLSIFLISHRAPTWGSEGIKLFAWLTLVAHTIWFLIGVFKPDTRYLFF